MTTGLRFTALTTLPLLLTAVSGCGGDSQPGGVSLLERSFPAQAPRVLDGQQSFVRGANGLALPAAPSPWRRSAVEVTLPTEATGAIVMRTDSGLELQVREDGATGAVRLVQDDVASYRSAAGTSFWRAVPGGAEQWLLLPQGVSSAHEPVARWHVEGASLRATARGIEVHGEQGQGSIQVVADEAYGPDGQPLGVRLAAHGPWLTLHVDASEGPVLIDPEWLNMATLGTGRLAHASAALQNGDVITTGGSGSGPGPLGSTEIYDAAAHSWSAGPVLLDSRAYHTATALDTGDVLVVGGWDGSFVYSNTELYQAGSNTMAGRPGLVSARAAHTATKLDNGQVLVCGGDGVLPTFLPWGGSGCFGSLGECELYDPSVNGGEWVDSAWMNRSRYAHAAALLDNGQVLIAGGDDCGFILEDAEVYDPLSNDFTDTSDMNVPRAYHTLTTLDDGRVLAAGGSSDGSTGLDSAEIWNPGNGQWTLTPTMNTARAEHTATLLDDGTVLVVGGFLSGSNVTDSAEIYDPVGNTWTAEVPIPQARAVHTATVLSATAVLVTGGESGLPSGLDNSWEYTITPTTTDCTVVNDCQPDEYCDTDTGECEPDKVNGDPATDPDECQSGIIADGVCCDAACDQGECDACTIALGASADGTCTDTSAGCDDGNECTVDLCDPTSGCRSFNRLDGTRCTAGSCIAGGCVPDGINIASDAGSGGGVPDAGGTGGEEDYGDPVFPGDPMLEGGGLCTIRRPGADGRLAPWILLLAAAPWLRRRRSPRN